MYEFKKTSIDEQETSISMGPLDKEAIVYSCEPRVVTLLLKYIETNPDEVHLIDKDDYGVSVAMPRKWIKYRPVVKRVMSEEQRVAAAERLRKAREAK